MDAAGMVNLLALRLLQYGTPKELSTWWQMAGRAGHDLSIDAVVILLVEPHHFDDEKEKAAQKAAEKAAE